MAFSDQDRDRVRDATSIVELFAAVTTVKKSGRTYSAICPFHQEKTPSMSLDPARGLYHCFGCGVGGDVFSFVQDTQGLSFPDALEFLAQKAGIVIEEDPGAGRRKGERRRLVEAVRLAGEIYQRRLKTAPEAGPARAYLRGRGYDAAVVDEFKIGYALASGDDLVRELRAGGVSDATMLEAGLARRGKGGRLYDYFRDRILFPISDVSGDSVGFGGRVLEGDGPKYLNTPDTRIYHKSRLLYGLDRVKGEIRRSGLAVIVEGYTDVIALHRAGYPVAVATCGTALGDDHFDLLRRFADRIVLAFDADLAGIKAALRTDSLEMPVRLDLDLRVAAMPPGADPADLAQRGDLELLREAVERAVPFLQFWIERELAEYDISEPESRARALRATAPRIARVSDEIARTEYIRFVAERLGIDIETVERAMGLEPRRRRRPAAVAPAADSGRRSKLERELLRAAIADGGGARVAGLSESDFSDDAYRQAFERVSSQVADVKPGVPLSIPVGSDEVVALLIELSMDARPVESVASVLAAIKRAAVEGDVAALSSRLATLDPGSDEYSTVFQDLVRLQQEKRDLDRS